jgi:hypothetical protein
MAANTSINLVNLDFTSLKESFKTYLKSQNVFKDYDFEGSNINVLLDVLSYNTYMNTFYLNMIGNEMFLDSAQLRESVISRAKELNYTPRSFKSARATVTLTIQTDGSVASVTMPKGTTFNTRIGSNTFTFSTDENKVISGANSTFVSDEIVIYEGQYVNDTFTVNNSDTTQRFVLSNPTIDTDSLTVTVLEDNGAEILSYLRATSLFDKQANSQIFFVQGAENDKYEVLFGDGVLGRKPKDNSIVVCEYRICKGELPNGAFKFTSDGAIQTFSNVAVTTVSAAAQGAIHETIESVKFNAPRYFTTQERAVTAEDYRNLLLLNFPEINAVSVYGGEEAVPPVFGKVFIAVDLKNVDGVPDIRKQQYYNFIKPRASLSIDPVFIDPDFMYVDIVSTVRYNLNTTALNSESLKELILTAIRDYNGTYLDDFNTTLRYSSLVKTIDAVDRSILSNDTTIRPIRLVLPETGIEKNYDIDFAQELENNFADLQTNHPGNYLSTIESTNFVVQNKLVSLEDDGKGKIRTITLDGTTHVVVNEVGTVDYKTGKVQLKRLNITEYTGSGIKIFARTKRKDISSLLRTILTIKDEDIHINIVSERE